MNAENLIGILESAAYNMGVSLQEIIVEVVDPQGYVLQIDGCERIISDNEDEFILRLKC